MMATQNYWMRRHVSRRAALRGAGLGLSGLVGAALVGCGSSSGTATPAATSAPAAAATSAAAAATATATEAPGLLASRAITDAQATPGGIYQGYTSADVTNLDPLSSQSFTANFASRWAYPQLLQFKPGMDGPAASGDVEGQLAQTYEFADPLKLVMHLRPEAKWDARAPTNSRPVDAQDVVFSWNKFAEKSISRKSLSNAASPTAPILKMTAVDDHTVQIDLAFQFAPLLGSLCYTRWFQIEPREADGGFDPRNDIRGAGPWMLDKYERSVAFTWRKNPNYWDKKLPYLDGFDVPIIGEYAQQLAQFRAGKIYGGVVSQQDILQTKTDLPELEVLQGDFYPGNWYIYFGLRPDSPFRDERVRRAVSMLIDRGQINDTFYALSEFKKADWPVAERWQSVGVSGGYDAFWIDPQGNEYTPEQKAAFAYNPDEAVKLIKAAGHDSISTKMSWIATGQYGTTFPKVGEAYKGLLEASGVFKIDQQNPDYQTEYLPNIYFGQGDFDGIAWGATTTYPNVVQHIQAYFHSKGERQKTAFKGDPASTDNAASDALIEKAMAAQTFEDQVALTKQWQKENVLRMPIVPSGWPYGVPGFGLHWPWVMNYGSYRDYGPLEMPEQTVYTHWWIDQAKLKAHG
jgi:ABC-type transport system substrate-binding protein